VSHGSCGDAPRQSGTATPSVDPAPLQFYPNSHTLRRVNSGKKTEDVYAEAGVNIHLADTLKGGLKQKVRKTRRPEVLGTIGGFGGLFALDMKKYKRPVLVSSMDGVGTKLKIAVALNKHDTVGQDLVNHCVNDIAAVGAEPLFFLDYIGMGKLEPRVFGQIIDGLVKACAEAGCALIGGETAQMPGMYSAGDYDLVSTIVGVVERDQIIDGSRIRPGDAIIGLASTGLHTNGYSLARQVLFAQMRVRLDDYHGALGCTFGEELLKVHRNYWPVIHGLQRSNASRSTLHGVAHITGGGFYDNIPRVLPKNCRAVIQGGSWEVPVIFKLLQEGGGVTDEEMHRVFNMGIGMVLIVDPKAVVTCQKAASRAGVKSYLIGEICKGKPAVLIE
jgi:phosphoribosylformylglycinamidine cyclo-ligase